MILKAKEFLKHIWDIIRRPEMLVLPGHLSYFFLLAIVPTITLLAYGASFFNLSFDFISNFLTKAFGTELAGLVAPIVSNVDINFQFFLTLFLGFYVASNGASSIIITSNQMYGIPNAPFLRRKVKALFMTFILIFLLFFLLFIPVFGTKIIEMVTFVNLNSNVTDVISFAIHLMQGPLSWFLIFFLIKIIYTMAPDKEISSYTNNYGALFATFGFIVITMIYSYYVNNFAHYATLYGGLAQFVILMVWLHLLAYVFVIGIAINAQKLEKIGDIKEKE